MSESDVPAQAGHRVLLGVTGCIAAYKSCELLRALQKRGCDVQVVMTAAAGRFIGTTTFDALSGHSTATELFGIAEDPIPHIRLAQSCDLFLIAPCTGNILAKIAHGIADDLLTSCALACTAPILIAPAMNMHMYRNAATQENIATLEQRGYHIMGTGYGRLACGDTGEGKLADVNSIADAAMKLLEAEYPGAACGVHGSSRAGGDRPLEGRRVMITSGPTIEPIDPVRFLSNRSSGKMGAALAEAACAMGAAVTVISGPASAAYPPEAEVVRIDTADEMLAEVKKRAATYDVLVFAAAVTDFKPEHAENHKIKRAVGHAALSEIAFIENPDILALSVRDRRDGQVFVGFAAETNDILSNGRAKLFSKGADIIVCNEVGSGKAFGTEDNAGWIITADAEEEIPCMPKRAMADIVLVKAASLLG